MGTTGLPIDPGLVRDRSGEGDMKLCLESRALLLAGALTAFVATSTAWGGDQAIKVQINTVTTVTLSGIPNTIYLANPEIADVPTIAQRKIFVVGRRIGQTSLIVLDADGNEMLVAQISVTPQTNRTLTVNRGVGKDAIEDMSCAPRCVPLATDISAIRPPPLGDAGAKVAPLGYKPPDIVVRPTAAPAPE
ncbi:hypothetical protein WCLP8_3960005 [uncultured Gammaproteobacteria bacterium]